MVKLITASMKVTLKPFWLPEAVLILVSTKKNDLWEGLTPEVLDSRTSRHSSRHSAHAQGQVWSDWLRIWNDYSAHAPKFESS